MARNKPSGGNLALWILVASIVVIPALQLASGQPTSAVWAVLTFAVLGAGVVFLGVIPWATGRWARQLLRAEMRRVPNAVASVAMLWDGSTPKELAVLVADANGLRFRGRADAVLKLGWRQVGALSTVSLAAGEHSISVDDAGGVVLARFVPVHPGGLYPTSIWKVDELRRKLDAVRQRPLVD